MKHGFERALKNALEAPRNIPAGILAGMLSCTESGFEEDLFAAARSLRSRLGKDGVLVRGLVEVSNICSKRCRYCGIRADAIGVRRYSMSEQEVLAAFAEAIERGYPAVALQAGELESEENTAFYERCLSAAGPLEVTLSLGEQDESVYKRWKNACKERTVRYLLRIETSNEELFARIHPQGQSFQRRLECIRSLRRLGFVTGSGVMIGLPGQTDEDLAADIVFFDRERLDMVGMGPYIPCDDTILQPPALTGAQRLGKSLRMIALARLYMWDINIVASTALQVLSPDGRAMGLDAGANVVMPNLTPSRYRCDYGLYPGKNEVVS